MTKAGTSYARFRCGQGLSPNNLFTAAQLASDSYTDMTFAPDGFRSAQMRIAWSYIGATQGRVILQAQTDNTSHRTRLKLMVPGATELPGNIIQLAVPAVTIGSTDRLRTYMRSESEFECDV